MNYTSESHIKSVKDVGAFFESQVLSKRPKADYFHHIEFGRKIPSASRRVTLGLSKNFHPDDMFEDNVSCGGGINTFILDECAIYNKFMDESLKVCEKEGIGIYENGMKELMPDFKI